MEILLLGIGIVLIVVSWHFVWLPTVLDSTRDKLFDLRDRTVRGYFVQQGISLDNKIYQELRTLINGHLRHTESLSFFGFMSMLVWTEKNSEINSEIRQRIEKRFNSDSVELRDFADKTREQAALIMLQFMIESSLLAFFLALVGTVVMLAHLVWKKMLAFFQRANEVSPVALGRFAFALLVVTGSVGMGSRVEARTAMEECALVRLS